MVWVDSDTATVVRSTPPPLPGFLPGPGQNDIGEVPPPLEYAPPPEPSPIPQAMSPFYQDPSGNTWDSSRQTWVDPWGNWQGPTGQWINPGGGVASGFAPPQEAAPAAPEENAGVFDFTQMQQFVDWDRAQKAQEMTAENPELARTSLFGPGQPFTAGELQSAYGNYESRLNVEQQAAELEQMGTAFTGGLGANQAASAREAAHTAAALFYGKTPEELGPGISGEFERGILERYTMMAPEDQWRDVQRYAARGDLLGITLGGLATAASARETTKFLGLGDPLKNLPAPLRWVADVGLSPLNLASAGAAGWAARGAGLGARGVAQAIGADIAANLGGQATYEGLPALGVEDPYARFVLSLPAAVISAGAASKAIGRGAQLAGGRGAALTAEAGAALPSGPRGSPDEIVTLYHGAEYGLPEGQLPRAGTWLMHDAGPGTRYMDISKEVPTRTPAAAAEVGATLYEIKLPRSALGSAADDPRTAGHMFRDQAQILTDPDQIVSMRKIEEPELGAIRTTYEQASKATMGGGLAQNMARAREFQQAAEEFAQQGPLRRILTDETGALDIGAIAQAAARLRPVPRPTGGVFRQIQPNQPIARELLAGFEGRTGTQLSDVGQRIAAGNDALAALKVGTRVENRRIVKETPEMRALFLALHGEGPVPPRMQAIYDDVRRLFKIEEDATLAADPDFPLREEYFSRFWLEPKATKAAGGAIGARPAFYKPRTEDAFSDLLAKGYQPLTWNPYEMYAIRARMGTTYREGLQLAENMKGAGLAVRESIAPDGWRVPRVGPAFEGKLHPYPIVDTGDIRLGKSGDLYQRPSAAIAGPKPRERWAVPNALAERLEGMFGPPADMGRTLNAVSTVSDAAKRLKLAFSLFQQVDFATRTGASGFAGAIDSAIHGEPLSVIRKLVNVPANLAKIPLANLSPARRQTLARLLTSSSPILKGRPDVSWRMLSEAGLTTVDTSIVDDLTRSLLREISTGQNVPGPVRRRIRAINAAITNGLFKGVYPEAQVASIRDHIAPQVMRQHPHWTPNQIARGIADQTNERFSTLGNYQTVFSNQVVRKGLRTLLFSTNETEALLRQAMHVAWGTHKVANIEYFLGAFAFLGATAEAIHYAATGEFLPPERFVPVSRDRNSPIRIGYNRNFMAPDVPFAVGRGGAKLSLDLMGQLDTVFRLLDPEQFFTARLNVLPRAAWNQRAGKTFFGEQLDTPGKRAEALLSDVAIPIPLEQLRGVAGLGAMPIEPRVGPWGGLIQASGLNVRAETNAELRKRLADDFYAANPATSATALRTSWDELTKKEQAAALAANPQIAAELGRRADEALAQGQDYAVAKKKMDDKRTAIDARFTGAQLEVDDQLQRSVVDAEEWRKETEKILASRAAALTDLYSEFPEQERLKNPLEEYYFMIERHRQGTRVDWDAVQQEQAAMPADWQKFVEDNLVRTLSTPTYERWRADRQKIEESGFWDPELRHKVDWLKERPETVDLLRSWGYSKDTLAALDTRKQFQAAQFEADRTITDGATWVDDHRLRVAALANRQAGIYADLSPSDRADQTAIDRYQGIKAAAVVDPTVGSFDWKKIDAEVAKLSPEDRAAIAAYESVWATPREKQYRQDMKAIADTGYFALKDDMFKAWTEAKGYSTGGLGPDEYFSNLQERWEQELLTSGLAPADASALAVVVLAKFSSQYGEALQRAHQVWREYYGVKLVRPLQEWGLGALGQKEVLKYLGK